MDITQELKKRLGDALLENEPLAKHSTFKIGGPAKFFVQGKTKDILIEAYKAARELKLPYLVLGGGSNLLVSDKGFEGMVLNVANDDIIVDDQKIFCGAGVPNAMLVKKAVDAGLTGCEWAIVIPGTVGGSIRGNAGAYGGDFSQITEMVEAFDGQQIQAIHKPGINFGYRESIFKRSTNPHLILTAVLNLKKGVKAEVKKNMLAHLNKKNTEHPMGLPSAGCVFKNVELLPGSYVLKDPCLGRPTDFFKSEVPQEFIDRGNVPSSFLIEAADLKGHRVGEVQVSPKHANYLVNLGKGRAEDVMILISIIKQKVRTTFGVQLKEEIQLVGF
ncbi:UDP-N-acetylmuramate dehydrogenase [Candidatus Uhrbacteria bacterium]|nr:UDP-N-acetylmuramate dehydrogenase [Candidatus Uhrbacteria bacterium]